MKKYQIIIYFLLLCSVSTMHATNSTPTVSRVYGDQFTQGIAPTQPSGLVGVLDTTFNTTGSVSTDSQLSGGTAQTMQVLSEGAYLVALSKDAADSVVAKYNAQGTVYGTASGVTGYGINGVIALGTGTTTLQARASMVDNQGRMIVVGGTSSGTAGWMSRVSTASGTIAGSAVQFATGTAWQFIAAVGEQTTGNIITVGFNGTNAQIARYLVGTATTAGLLDPAFGTPATPGYVILNGAASGLLTLPTVNSGLYNVVIDANNLIYVAYVDASGGAAHIARFTAVGLLDATFGTNGIANISFLNSPASPIYMAMDLNSNLVAAAQVGNNILVTSIDAPTGGAAIPSFTDATITSAGNVLTIGNLATTSDGTSGKILVNGSVSVGSGPAIPYSRVTRLTNIGALDTAFNVNGTPGYNQFRIGTPDTTSTLLGSGLSPDGQLYVVGYQRNGSTNTGYVSRLYNDFNTYQVSQSPETQEQGNVDLMFGSTVLETNLGVVTPFNGLYRGALQQQAEYVIELTSGNLLVGMDGYTNTAAQSSMVLVRLLPTGVLDGSFGSGGKITLPNITSTNEHITSLFEDGSTNIYVTGYSGSGAIFRKYTSAGTLIWNSDILTVGFKGLGVGLEGSNRVLLFAQATTTTGQISGYDVTTGAIDPSFNAGSGHAGYIYSTDYAGSVLNMGPVYGGVVASSGNFFIAYKDSTTGMVDVAQVFNAASGLVPTFGVDGIVQNLFSSATMLAENIHVAFNDDFNCIVVGSEASVIKVALLDATDGDLNSSFNGGAILSITVPSTTSVMLNKVTGISDGSLIITGYDNGTDDTMLIIRVTAAGALDTTFNSQGTTPGILTIKVGDQLADFNARVATSLTVQSHTGINQGNLIVAGYEKQFSSDSTPMVMRVFGQPGTTEVKSSPLVITVPGDFDTSYNSTGKATTYANGESSPSSNQQVKAIREMIGMNIMTVISDGINSWTTQLESDSTLYTSYGSRGSALIVKGNGDSVAEFVNGMVFDGSGNMLVFGSNDLLGGYVKRILINGSMDTTFGGYTGNPTTLSYPAGTAYGVMSEVHAVAQLTNGNIVAVGNQGGVGTAIMLSNTGVQLSTFGVSGSVTNGINITSVSADSSNNIYVSVGYLDTDALKKVRIMKMNASGVLDTSYGSGGMVNAAISNIDNYTSIRLVLNEVGKVVVAASFGGATGQVAVLRFDTNGSVDVTFNGGVQQDITFVESTTVQVTSLVALENGKTLVAGYQYDPVVVDNDDFEFVACIDTVGNLDGLFGSGATAGLVTFQIAGGAQQSRYLWDMNIQTNGGILLCGAESPAVDEQTPFTARLYGYTDIQAVPQFIGYVPVPAVSNILDLFFNGTGIGSTGLITTLVRGGDVVVDSLGRPIIGGYTTTGQLLVARFTTTGVLDTTFGSGGIAQTTSITNLLQGQYVAVDNSNRVYIGGITNDFRFILARFTSAGVLDTTFAGGVTQSVVFANLSTGGHVTVDSLERPVIGGMSSDGKLVAARFTTLGAQDTFGSSGITSATVASLSSGGFVTTDTSNNVYVTGMTSLDTLVCVKFSSLGVIVSAYGTSGIASTAAIPHLSTGGSVGINSSSQIIIGGQTTNEVFVVAKFLITGLFDPSFGTAGIAYSGAVDGLKSFANLNIDSNDRIVLGGYSSDISSTSFIVARLTPTGALDTVLSVTGMGTSGPVSDLVLGGYVATNVFDNIFAGGFTTVPSLVVAEFLSGEEHFVVNPSQLSAEQYKIYMYGNNPDLFKKFLGIELFARFITDAAAQAATVTAVNGILDAYADIYAGQPGWNLLESTYRVDAEFDSAQATLRTGYPGSTTQINTFFDRFNIRRAYFYVDSIV